MLSILTNDFCIALNGLSTDVKPTLEKKSNGSSFTEIDTGKKFLYDGEHQTWYELKTSGSGSGSSTTYYAGDGININSANVISIVPDEVSKQLSLSKVATSGSYLDLTDTPEITTYTAGFGISIVDSAISIDQTKIATLDSVKEMLADATSEITIAATSIEVQDDSGNLVPVATANLLTTDTPAEKLSAGNYVFTSLSN